MEANKNHDCSGKSSVKNWITYTKLPNLCHFVYRRGAGGRVEENITVLSITKSRFVLRNFENEDTFFVFFCVFTPPSIEALNLRQIFFKFVVFRLGYFYINTFHIHIIICALREIEVEAASSCSCKKRERKFERLFNRFRLFARLVFPTT